MDKVLGGLAQMSDEAIQKSIDLSEKALPNISDRYAADRLKTKIARAKEILEERKAAAAVPQPAPEKQGVVPPSEPLTVSEPAATTNDPAPVTAPAPAVKTEETSAPAAKPEKPSFAQRLMNQGISEQAAEKGQKNLEQALVDPAKAKEILHPETKKYRAIWEDETGIKLPKTLKATHSAIEDYFADKQFATGTPTRHFVPAGDTKEVGGSKYRVVNARQIS